MKILITGSGGQLGSELKNILQTKVAEIGHIPSLYGAVEVIACTSSQLDITNREAVEDLISSHSFDLIINCAAMTDVDACETEQEKAFSVNAYGPQNLAIAAQKVGAKLVHVSTDYVFSGNDHKEYCETDRVDPQNTYGHSKLEGEKLVQEECDRCFIVRTAWLYSHTGRNFVKTITRIAKEKASISVVDDQFGNPTSVNDVAFEILKIAETENYGVYHCTNNGVCSWYDFASEVVDCLGIPCEKIRCSSDLYERPAKRPAYSPLMNEHLGNTIGDDMRCWKDALKSYAKHVSDLEG